MEKDYKSARKITRLALPIDDSYLYNLGVALYGFNSINSFMIEIICHANQNESSIKLIQLTSGGVLNKFRSTLSYLKKGDCLIIAGKGHESSQEINGEFLKFNDREEVEKFL